MNEEGRAERASLFRVRRDDRKDSDKTEHTDRRITPRLVLLESSGQYVKMSISLHLPTFHEYGVTDRNSAPAHSDTRAGRATSGGVAGSGRRNLRRSGI